MKDSVFVNNDDNIKSTFEPHSKRSGTEDRFSGDGSKGLLRKLENSRNSDHAKNAINRSGAISNMLPSSDGQFVAVGSVTGGTVNVVINYYGEKSLLEFQ